MNTKFLRLGALLLPILGFSQNLNLEGPAQNIANSIKSAFPFVAVSIFVVVILVNLGHFVKEGGDWKKGLTNIVLFAVVLGIVTGLVSYVESIRL